MSIRFHCDACEARVKVPGGNEGRKVKCPRCGQLQRVPTQSLEPAGVGEGSGVYSPPAYEPYPAHEKVDDRLEAMAQSIAKDTPETPEASPPEISEAQQPLFEETVREASEPPLLEVVVKPRVRVPAPSKAIAMTGPTDQVMPTVEEKVEPPEPPVAPEPQAVSQTSSAAQSVRGREFREARPYTALKNLATGLRITPAFLIPVMLWHVLATTTVSGMFVTLIVGIAGVAMTWTLAEIADTVRDIARRECD